MLAYALVEAVNQIEQHAYSGRLLYYACEQLVYVQRHRTFCLDYETVSVPPVNVVGGVP